MPRQFARVYIALIAAQFAIEVLIVVLGSENPTSEYIVLLIWLLLGLTGFGAGLARVSLRRVALLALPFPLISFAHGLLSFALGWEDVRLLPASVPDFVVFSGLLVASAVLTALSVAFATLAAVAARFYLRARGVRGSAA